MFFSGSFFKGVDDFGGCLALCYKIKYEGFGSRFLFGSYSRRAAPGAVASVVPGSFLPCFYRCAAPAFL